jgi:Flp pilus assembly protein TadG
MRVEWQNILGASSDDATRQLRARGGRPCRSRGGMALVYVLIIWTVLCGFVSLGMDWGRVQITKTELQVAADAASRAAIAQLPNGVTAVQNAAVAYAGYNTADGTSVVLNVANDVEFGTWDSTNKTFAVLSGAARTTANAIRITARRTAANGNAVHLTFGGAVGMATVDCKSQVIAAMLRVSGYQIVSLNTFVMSGDAFTDSYDSSLGSYGSQTPTQKGTVASNANYSFSGSPSIKGDLYYLTGSAPNGATVTGSKTRSSSALSYSVAALPASYTEHGSVSLSGNGTLTLGSGNHHFSSFTTNSSHCQLIINPTSGPVKMYCDGAFSFGINAVITFNSIIPANFELHMRGSNNISLPNDFYGVIDAPDCDVSLGGNSIYGSVVAESITMGSGERIHADLALLTTTISTVK